MAIKQRKHKRDAGGLLLADETCDLEGCEVRLKTVKIPGVSLWHKEGGIFCSLSHAFIAFDKVPPISDGEAKRLIEQVSLGIH